MYGRRTEFHIPAISQSSRQVGVAPNSDQDFLKLAKKVGFIFSFATNVRNQVMVSNVGNTLNP